MKKLFFLFCLFALTGTNAFCASEPTDTIIVSHIVKNSAIITADAKLLASDWQAFLNIRGFKDSHIKKVQVVANTSNYYLVATGTLGNKKLRSTLQLQRLGGCLFITGATVTCTTTDCANEPLSAALHGDCAPCANGGQCKKIVAAGPVLLFSHATIGGCSGK